MSFDGHLTFAILYEPNCVNCKLVTKVIYSFSYFPLLYFKAHSYDNLKQLMVVFLHDLFVALICYLGREQSRALDA